MLDQRALDRGEDVLQDRHDDVVDQAVARSIPGVNVTAGLERSGAVASRLDDLTGHRPAFTAAKAGQPTPSGLPVLGTAPDFAGTGRWFNTPGGGR